MFLENKTVALVGYILAVFLAAFGLIVGWPAAVLMVIGWVGGWTAHILWKKPISR